MDNTIDNNKEVSSNLVKFPIVAIGASAGGLEAINELLEYLSVDTGMAFVYVQHLNRTLPSNLSAILQRSTEMPVIQVEEGAELLPDHLYVIPPNTDMVIVDNHFELSKRESAPVKHSPIDRFFVSLAALKRVGTVAIILSGTASDGTVGMKAIKEAGSLTYAQNSSAFFQSMPASAIATGIVDSILSPKEMAMELDRISKSRSLLTLMPPEPEDVQSEENVSTNNQPFPLADVRRILALVKNVMGVDFINYKPNTISRRIIRRMLVNRQDNLTGYFTYLKNNREEVSLLYQDLLINVTHFFRDADACDYLQKVLLPDLLQYTGVSKPLRIWVPACSTGEEAYSLAMMLVELIGDATNVKPFQIFATDLSETAIAKARAGLYSATDVMQMSRQRIERFFAHTDGQYRIIKRIRECCVFAPHNVFKDPPFSRVDIVSCCNLMIYLDTELQKKLLSNFQYALNNGGYLVLGKSETIGSSTHLFTPATKKARIYQKKSEVSSKAVFDLSYTPAEIAQVKPSQEIPVKLPVKELTNTETIDGVIDNILLLQYVPAGVVVNYDLDIVQFRGSTGLFLEPSPGRATLHLLKMVRSGIELELRNAIQQVIKSEESFKVSGLDITHKNNVHHVAFEVIPLIRYTKEKLLLIIFEEVKTPSPADLKVTFSKDRRVKQLEAELIALRQDMRSLIEEQEAANEELQSANEEIVSSNEELQSINEELETSKEELESSNEELVTINQELQVRNDQLYEAHYYNEIVIETIREAVLILDPYFVVKSANKAFYRTFNLKISETEDHLIYEVGNGQWNIPKLREMLQENLQTSDQVNAVELSHFFKGIGQKTLVLSVKKIVQNSSSSQLILLAIEDITDHKQAEKLLEEREVWLRNMANNVPVMLWVAGANETFTFVNKTWIAYTGRSLQKEIGLGWTEGIYKDDLERVLQIYHTSFEEKKAFDIEYRMRRYDGEFRWILNSAVPSYDADGTFAGFTGSCNEIHSKKLLNEELEKQVQERTNDLLLANTSLERSNIELAQFAYVASHDLQEPLRKIITFAKRLKERFLESIPEGGKDYIDKINLSAERMRNLIDDLLNFSRISRFEKKFVKTDLNKVVRDVLEDFDLLIQEKNAVVQIGKLPVLNAVPLQMNQLFYNLISNALKFTTPHTRPVITISCLLVSPEELNDVPDLDLSYPYYKIIVEDNGIGFSQEFAEQIFIIFQRLNDKEDYPGTGIGLALCRKIVRNHSGDIIAKSEEGKGSSFHILLPSVQVSQENQ